MLIHLGAGTSVCSEDILTLTDLQLPLSPDTAALLDAMKSLRQVRWLGKEPKTMILVRHENKTVCYLSCVGLRTLRMRIEEECTLLARLAARSQTGDT